MTPPTKMLQQEQLSLEAAAKATTHKLLGSSREMKEPQLTTGAAAVAAMISSCPRQGEAALCISFAQSARCS